MDYRDFTPEFKDSVLRKICEEFDPYSMYTFENKMFSDDNELLYTCFRQFEEMGLIINYGGGLHPTSHLTVTAKALDFLNMGGFTFLANRFTKELEKANLELDKLKAKPSLKDYVEQISGVSGIISNLISAVGALVGGKV